MAATDAQAAPDSAGRPLPTKLFWIPVLLADLLLLVFLKRAHLVALILVSLGALLALLGRPRLALALSAVGTPLFYPLYEVFRTELPGFLLARLLVLAPLCLLLWDRLWAWPGGKVYGISADLGRHPIVRWSAALGVVLALTSLWTPTPGYALFKVGAFFTDNLLVLAAAAILLASRDREKQAATGFRFLGAVLGVELLIAGAALWNFFTHYYPFSTRLVTLGANPVFLGRQAAVGLLALAALASSGRARTLWALPAAALLLWVLYRTGSRGPILGLALALAFFIGTSPRGIGRKMRPLLIFSLLAGAGFLIFYLPDLAGESVAQLGDREGSNAMRMFMLQTAWGSIRETFPWGLGTGGFAALLKLGDVRFFPHNIFVEVFLENGVLGLLVLLGLVVAVVRLWFSTRRRAARLPVTPDEALLLRAAGSMLVFAMAMAQVGGDLITNDLLWLWCGALIAWSRWNGTAAPLEGGV